MASLRFLDQPSNCHTFSFLIETCSLAMFLPKPFSSSSWYMRNAGIHKEMRNRFLIQETRALHNNKHLASCFACPRGPVAIVHVHIGANCSETHSVVYVWQIGIWISSSGSPLSLLPARVHMCVLLYIPEGAEPSREAILLGWMSGYHLIILMDSVLLKKQLQSKSTGMRCFGKVSPWGTQ